MFEAKALSAGYGRAQVLWDVDLRVGENEIVALVGPNGAGKTTLLRALTGMVEIRSGTVEYRGQTCRGARSSRSQASASRTSLRVGACSRG